MDTSTIAASAAKVHQALLTVNHGFLGKEFTFDTTYRATPRMVAERALADHAEMADLPDRRDPSNWRTVMHNSPAIELLDVRYRSVPVLDILDSTLRVRLLKAARCDFLRRSSC